MSSNILKRDNQGFTLVEIMIVVAIIGLLAALAVPGFVKARKQSQGRRIMNDCRQMDAAVDQWSVNSGIADGTAINTIGRRYVPENGVEHGRSARQPVWRYWLDRYESDSSQHGDQEFPRRRRYRLGSLLRLPATSTDSEDAAALANTSDSHRRNVPSPHSPLTPSITSARPM